MADTPESLPQKYRRETRENKARGLVRQGSALRKRSDVLAELLDFRRRRISAGGMTLQGGNAFFTVDPNAASPYKEATPEVRAQGLKDSYLEAYSVYLATNDPTERQKWHDLSMSYRRELVDLVGEPAARTLLGEQSQAPEEPDNEQEPEDIYTPPELPTRAQLVAFFNPKGQHPIAGGRGNPEDFSTQGLQAIYEALDDADQTIGQDDPEGYLDGFVAGTTGPSDIDIAAIRAVKERERQQSREEEALRRETERARQKAERDAERAQQKAEAEAERQQRQQEQSRLRIEQERQKQQQRQQSLTRTAMLRGAQALGHVDVRLGSLPTPGGVPLLLFTILFIIFALVPQNRSGATRIQLLWFALVGKVTLPTSGEPDAGGHGGNGVWGSIGAGIGSGIGGTGGLANPFTTLSSNAGGASDATTSAALSDYAFSVPYASS